MTLLWLSIAFLTGILLANAVSLSMAAWFLLAGAAFTGSILIAVLSRWLTQRVSLRPRAIQSLPYPFSPAFVVLLFAAVFLGASRYQAKQPDLSDPGFIAWYNSVQDKVILEGVIVEPPDVRDTYTYLRLAVEKIRLASDSTLLFHPVHGLLLVMTPPGGTWHYGDRVHLEGQLETPDEATVLSISTNSCNSIHFGFKPVPSQYGHGL